MAKLLRKDRVGIAAGYAARWLAASWSATVLGPMSSELRIGLIALVGTVALYFGLSSILPASWRIESQAQIEAPATQLVPLFADFRSWQEWTTLSGTARTDTKVEVEGDPGKPGHRIVWRSNQNEAALQLVAVREDGVDYEFTSRLGKEGKQDQIGRGSIRAVAAVGGQGTVVTWSDESSVGTFVERWFLWFGVLQEKAKEFQQASLQKLKQRAEGKLAPTAEQPKQAPSGTK